MDHNFNLLKSATHAVTRSFLNIFSENDILPTITRPMRICKKSATLIDNIFISQNLHKQFDSAILIQDMLNHMPTLALLK